MKTTIFSFIMVALLFIGCTQEAPVDYALISGKIANIKTNKVTLIKRDKTFKKEITIAANGAFKDTINSVPGKYDFIIGKNSMSIFLEQGNDLTFLADAENFNATLNVSGKGSEATDYLISKKRAAVAFKGKSMDAYKVEEVDFKRNFKEIQQDLESKLDTMQGVSTAFKTLEKRNLSYEYINELERYSGGYHRQWARKRSYRPSAEFLTEREGLDLNSEVDFYFSDAYKEIIDRYYNKKINALSRADSLEYGLQAVTAYATIPNQAIRNDFIFKKAEYDLYQTIDFEKFYSIFINASTNEENNAVITKIYNDMKRVTKGNPSPKFIAYEKHSGGTLSLDDLKGKYIYIDVWATWCGPCLKEVPDLKRVEKLYHNKNISFLSISIDEVKNKEKWKEMVIDKKLGGIQVFADDAFNSQFIKDYQIRSIPRFIIIDPDGVIVSQNAPKPSDPKLIDLFNELNI